jgi:hypothetical protein
MGNPARKIVESSRRGGLTDRRVGPDSRARPEVLA